MVAERHGVIAHQVQGLGLQKAAVFGEIDRALAEVTSVEQEHVLRPVRFPDTVHIGRPLDQAAGSDIISRADGLEMGMGVIDMQDGQMMLRLRCAGDQGHEGRYCNYLFHKAIP